VLDVCTLTNSWTVCRRYSDFDELNAKVLTSLPYSHLVAILPDIFFSSSSDFS